MNIHFVCRGNVLRSIIAEAYLKSLHLKNVNASSSGVAADRYRGTNQDLIANTKKLLKRHHIGQYGKDTPEQVSPERLEGQDIIVVMNQVVIDESAPFVELPADIINWDITDIGEGDRTVLASRLEYEEIIYTEVTAQVDELVAAYKLG